MQISDKIWHTALALLLLISASLACNAPTPRLAGPAPARTIQPSAEALESFNSKWHNLNLATPDGPFSVTFTEEELTSAVDAAIIRAETENGQDIPLENVQVELINDVINVYALARLDPLTVNGLIVVVPRVGTDGQVEIVVNQIEFGPLQFNESVLDAMVATFEQSINAPINASPFDITLEAIHISDGQLTINGVIMP